MNEYALNLDAYPAYIYDLPGLESHVKSIRAALGPAELFYAAKANPDAEILRTLGPHVDGIEISSGGELAHVRKTLPGTRIAFGGPGKTTEELSQAVNIDRIHVESPRELIRLAALGRADVLVRANLPLNAPNAALTMSGPFGMDEEALNECARLLREHPHLTLRGIHTHLASGLDAPTMLDLARRISEWALPWLEAQGVTDPELNLGGGMAVDYTSPRTRFDWRTYGTGLTQIPARVRIEPGRAVTAYHGWYVTDVLDVKTTRGETYVILRGGTHHLRTPVTKGHDQPFEILTAKGPESPATLVGQLCTPKDVFARDVPVPPLSPGDIIAFAMAGAYAWNISHHDFLMHPKPAFHYLR